MQNGKIVAGIGGNVNPSDIWQIAQAGVDEVFVGFVPTEWSDKFGFATSPNRRTWREASFTEIDTLESLLKEAHENNLKVSLALNEHQYSARTRSLVLGILQKVVDLSVDAVIVAEPDLFFEIRNHYPHLPLHLSGETGVYNTRAVQLFGECGARRIILPRHITLDEIAAFGKVAKKYSFEIEAFIMSERCTFEGAFCFSSHGYLKNHLCNELNNPELFITDPAKKQPDVQSLFSTHYQDYRNWRSDSSAERFWIGGECGICACRKLLAGGVSYFKIVSRGAGIEEIVKKICTVRLALDNKSENFEEYCQSVVGKNRLCSQGYRCYYRD